VRRLFDGVASLGVLYHVHDPLTTLIMYQRYLRPGGFLLLETGAVADDVPVLYYTGEGLIYGKEGGNQFMPSTAFLEESLGPGLGFEVLSTDFRETHRHERLGKGIGRSFIVAARRGLPTMHSYPIVVEQLGMTGETFGPIEWAYGPWPPANRWRT
jgi:SAM-dependent methyltransferase